MQSFTVAILGSGFAGLCMAIRLKQAGIRSFTIFEKASQVGGTWRENSYPGAACDVPSHLYSFSFEPKYDWSRIYAPQAEIQQYLESCVTKYELGPHLKLGVEIASATFDESANLWRLRSADGQEFTANIVVSGVGQLNRPYVPEIPGREEFGGIQFHSARWNHNHDLNGRQVAVIGNAASALQFIPKVAGVAKQLTVFQRHPNWVIPRHDRALTAWEKWTLRYVPGAYRMVRALIYFWMELHFYFLLRGSWVTKFVERWARRTMEKHIHDPALRSKLTPDFLPGCKRLLISDDYYQALARDNTTVITDGIERITREGLITRDGTLHSADTLIFATGFESTNFLAPIEIRGLGGRSLKDAWKTGAEAYLGMTVAGFPNLFLLYGPNTNLGHNSIVFMIECQVNYVLQCLARLRGENRAWLNVREAAQDDYNRQLQRKLATTVWSTRCSNWYKLASGKITNNWSGPTLSYWWQTRTPDWNAFEWSDQSAPMPSMAESSA